MPTVNYFIIIDCEQNPVNKTGIIAMATEVKKKLQRSCCVAINSF